MLRQMIVDEISQMIAVAAGISVIDDASTKADIETIADCIVNAVGKWLESDDVRPIIYDGLSTFGPTTKNVGAALAKAARST